jgi:exodeoxyribonuclease-5
MRAPMEKTMLDEASLTADQKSALIKIRQWKRDCFPNQVFRLTGLAGTGKTTLLHMAKAYFRNPIVTALTGKAASVLRAKGHLYAVNVHRLIYKFDGLDDEDQPLFRDNGDPLSAADVIFLDEASMINAQLAGDLLSRGIPVLAVGDPGQLHPVSGASWFKGSDAHLSQICRQAEASPIIQAAHLIRSGEIPKALKLLDYRKSASRDEVMQYDQILIGTHKTRCRVIGNCRAALGFPQAVPAVNDRIVCERNNHRLGLCNGDLFTVEEVNALADWYAWLTVSDVAGARRSLAVSIAGLCELGAPAPDQLINFFRYSYALTVHKAQGSEWPSVAVKLDWNGDHYDRWLYTAITRAKSELLVLE